MTRKEGGIPTSLDETMENNFQDLFHLLNEVRTGNLSKSAFIKKVHDVTVNLDHLSKSAERQNLDKIAAESGVESLGTDSQGNRSERQLAESGRAFATGVASRCLAVAVIHPEVGIGAAHYNPITPTVMTNYLARRINQGIISDDLLINPNPDRVMEMVGTSGLQNITRQTISRALTEFKGIEDAPQYIPTDTQVILTGLDFISSEGREVVINTTLDSIHSVVQGQQKGTGNRTNIRITEHVMEPGGTLYGGVSHPIYAQPAFYKLT